MQFQTQYSAPMAGQGTMPGRTPGMSAAGMDWSGEITPPPVPQGASVVAFDDPAAIRDASANARATPSGQLGPLSWTQNAAPAPMDLRHGLPADVIESPTTLEEARLGSLKAMLARYVGSYIVASFLVGTQNMVSWEGILYDVGNDYLTIYQENRDRYVVSDYYSLKFIEFYDTRRRTFCNAVMESQNGMSGT